MSKHSLANAIGKALDSVYLAFNPEKAIKRAKARALYNMGYEGASINRRMPNIPFDGRAEEVNEVSRDILRKRARDLERNSPITGAITQAMQTGVIGNGFTIQVMHDDENYDSTVEKLWNKWVHHENCDYLQRQSLDDMLKMIVLRLMIDGGVIVTFKTDKKRKIPLTLQIHEVDELDTTDIPKTENGNVILNGIELTEDSREVAYWLKQTTPDGMTDLKPVRVPKEDAIFLWAKTRPTQYREITKYASTIALTKDLSEYNGAVSMQQKISACTMGVIEQDNPMVNVGRAPNQADGSRVESIEGGTVRTLKPGEKMKLLSPNGQAVEASTYIPLIQRILSAPWGLSLESTSRNVEKVNYSSARQNLVVDQIVYKNYRKFLEEYLLRPIFKRFVNACYLKGYLDRTSFNPNDENYYEAEWLGTSMAWIDPLKEANANMINLSSGGKSFQSYCAEQGVDWRDRIAEMKEAQEYAEKMGVTLSFVQQNKSLDENEDGDNVNSNKKENNDMNGGDKEDEKENQESSHEGD